MKDEAKKEVKKLELKKEVSDKYNIVPGFGIGEMYFRGSTYHLDQMSVEEVDALVESGCTIFTLKAKTAPAPAKA